MCVYIYIFNIYILLIQVDFTCGSLNIYIYNIHIYVCLYKKKQAFRLLLHINSLLLHIHNYYHVYVCICIYISHICMYLHVHASTRQLEAYHMRSLPLEWHGMNGLMSLPIAVIDIDTGKELQLAGHVGNVHKPSHTERNWPDASCLCLPSDAGSCRRAIQFGK